MEEIKVGEWVRFKNGALSKNNSNYNWNIDEVLYDGSPVAKHSENIIDLIEVGDYVNGHLVVDVDNINTGVMREVYCEDNEDFGLWNEHINSVVTKEQFSSVEYRVEGDK